METGYAQQMEDFLTKLREVFYPSYGIPLWLIVAVLIIGFVIIIAWRFANWRFNRLKDEFHDLHERHSYYKQEWDHERELHDQKVEALNQRIQDLGDLSDLSKRVRKGMRRMAENLADQMVGEFAMQEERLNQLATLSHADMGELMRFISLSGFMASSTITPAEKVEVSGVLAKMMEEWGTPENPDGTPIVLANLPGAPASEAGVEYEPAFTFFSANLDEYDWDVNLANQLAQFLKEAKLRMEDITYSDTQDGNCYTLTILYPKRVERH